VKSSSKAARAQSQNNAGTPHDNAKIGACQYRAGKNPGAVTTAFAAAQSAKAAVRRQTRLASPSRHHRHANIRNSPHAAPWPPTLKATRLAVLTYSRPHAVAEAYLISLQHAAAISMMRSETGVIAIDPYLS
jgi:hypothetical protein